MVLSSPAPPRLQTARLVLRPFEAADAAAVQALAGRREIADTTLRMPHPYPDGAAEAWIATHEAAWLAGQGVIFAIAECLDETLVGTIGLTIDVEAGSAEMGYWIAVERWNRGYCTEAARAVLDFAFTTLALNRVQARHLVRNPASGRVLAKIGMAVEGTQRQALRKWGRFEDVAMLAILAADRTVGRR